MFARVSPLCLPYPLCALQDVFIIDQHASDEKYHFEQLQQNTVMRQQPLLVPLPLDQLTAQHELCIREHMHVFVKNGFTFIDDEQLQLQQEAAAEAAQPSSAAAASTDSKLARTNSTPFSVLRSGSGGSSGGGGAAPPPPTAVGRLRLKSVPFSKGRTFGVDDIYELCALLSHSGDDGGSVGGAGGRSRSGGSGAGGAAASGRKAIHTHIVPKPASGAGAGGGDSSGEAASGPIIRLPKVSAMFASRACRSAVMIGDALNTRTMQTIVRHMGTMQHPWACPHGNMRASFASSAAAAMACLTTPLFLALAHLLVVLRCLQAARPCAISSI
jgi:DNA mismatch repair protein PMS2